MSMQLLRAVVAEAIGTFVLVGIGSLAMVSATGQSLPTLLVVPFGFGLGVLAAIAIFGHVSGGHFNPAVTLGALLDGRIDILGTIGYWIAQLVGAIVASLVVLVVVNKEAVAATMTSGGVPEDGAVFLIETIMTAIFVAVVLTVTRKSPALAPLVIALTLAAVHFAALPISGAAVNPARALAPAIVSGKLLSGTTGIWVYLAGPMLGGLIGWGVYRFSTPPEDEDELELEDEDELEDELESELDEEPSR